MACTVDSCDENLKSCLWDFSACGCVQDSDCDDGLFCNGAETCDKITNTCVGGISVIVDDSISCTVDVCDETTKKIILCLDSDFAGDEAAKRGAILAENLGFEVKVARLVGFKDPDEIARAKPDLYKKAIEDAIGIWDFFVSCKL